jgi:hypothetical protein
VGRCRFNQDKGTKTCTCAITTTFRSDLNTCVVLYYSVQHRQGHKVRISRFMQVGSKRGCASRIGGQIRGCISEVSIVSSRDVVHGLEALSQPKTLCRTDERPLCNSDPAPDRRAVQL